jgi:hypothetical protein
LIGKYKTIVNYYKEVFNMTRYGNYKHAELMKLLPYEMEIFTALTLQAMEEEKQQRDKNG